MGLSFYYVSSPHFLSLLGFSCRVISLAGRRLAPHAPTAPGASAPPVVAPIPVPAMGTMEALFATPPSSQCLRQVRDLDALWEMIDATREALMESEISGGTLCS